MTQGSCIGVVIVFSVLLFSGTPKANGALVLDDPLQGATTGTRAGGTFVTGGWMVTGKDDSIFWHVPTITNGAVEWSVTGLAPNECRAGMEDKTELFHMYDNTWNNSDYSYAPGYRDNPFKHFVRKTGCLDTVRVNSMEILWLIGANLLEGDSPVLSWNTGSTYLFREEWGPDGAGNSTLRTYRDGVLILTQTVPGVYAPAGQSVRIGASTRRAADAGAPLGAVFSNVKVWDNSRPTPDPPVITEPASGQTVSRPVVFIQWSGEPHTRYEVRVCRVDDPDSSIAWKSGAIDSGRSYAWTGPLNDPGDYFVFARLGSGTGWSRWSAAGRQFRVDTRVAPTGPNLVRVAGNSLSDGNGPFLGLGASYFQALRKAKYDRARLKSDLALLASKGFNYVRILSMVNWDGLEIAPVNFTNSAGHPVQAWPDYWQQFRDLLDLVAAAGLRAEVTIFADAQYVMPNKATRLAHLDGILADIAGREAKIIHLEVANEAWQNGFPGSQGIADLREFAQYLGDRTSVPVAITSNDDTSNAGITALYTGSAADLATVHFSRDIGTAEGGWLPVRDCYRAGNLPGVPPVSSNEPIGPGSSVNSENDPIKLCAAAVFAYLANLPCYVYHTRAGVYGWVNCCPPSGGEVRFENTAGINAYQFIRQILPPEVASWVRNDGIEASAPFTVFCNGQANRYWPDVSNPTNGCHRNIGSAKEREFVSFPMGILGGGLTLQTRRPVKVQVFNPLTGAVVSNVTLMNPGSQVTLPQGPGAYILKGAWLDFQTTLVPKGAAWKYLDDGYSQGTAWRTTNFNDSAWASGPAQLGYGEGDEATVIGYGPVETNKFVTSYFRRAFPVANPAAFTLIGLRLLRDDGAVVYVNGIEVFRSNLPGGAITSTTFASEVVNGADETNYFTATFSPGWLVRGNNVVAVEVHQANADSSDLSFDLEMIGIGNTPPLAAITAPSHGASVSPDLSIEAAAWDTDGTVKRVEFQIDGIKVGEDTTAPFTVAVTNLPVGVHALSATATDDSGATGTSTAVSILVKDLLLASGAVWKYLDNGSNQGTAWRQLNFDDNAWPSGPAQLGYGDGDESTVLNFGPYADNKYVTTYFRHPFVVSGASGFTNLNLRLLRDDGAIIYLNGVEVFRSNMPTGAVNSLTYAGTPVAGADETTYFVTDVDPALLAAGTNLLAVEIHQANATSTDLSFDLELSAESAPPPPPRLSIARFPGSILLSWPAPAFGFHLQSAPTLVSSPWSAMTNTVITTNSQHTVPIPLLWAQAFYRLSK